jgi:hypothetical protein
MVHTAWHQKLRASRSSQPRFGLGGKASRSRAAAARLLCLCAGAAPPLSPHGCRVALPCRPVQYSTCAACKSGRWHASPPARVASLRAHLSSRSACSWFPWAHWLIVGSSRKSLPANNHRGKYARRNKSSFAKRNKKTKAVRSFRFVSFRSFMPVWSILITSLPLQITDPFYTKYCIYYYQYFRI